MGTSLVKRWKETTEPTRQGEYFLDGGGLEVLARAILDDIGENNTDVVWAKVEVTAHIIVLTEMEVGE